MVVPIFSLKLNNKISTRTVSIGKYDGIHPCLTAATLAGKVKKNWIKIDLLFFKSLFSCQVFIHNPHQKYTFEDKGQSDEKRVTDTNINLLNINEVVTSLSTGQLNAAKKSDTLLVGTKTNILAYDVDNNMDLFYKEVRFQTRNSILSN